MHEEQQKTDNFDYGCSAIPAEFDSSRVVEVDRKKLSSDFVSILKPHGSINWMYCDICSRPYWFKPKYTVEISNRLFKAHDRDVVTGLTGKACPKPKKLGACPDCTGLALGTRFATFSYRKALEFPMHYATWARAEELLQDTSSWIFVGYSLPPADYQFKHLLKRVQLSRATRPPTILVITKEAPAGPTAENYRRFFGFTATPDANVLIDGRVCATGFTCYGNKARTFGPANQRRHVPSLISIIRSQSTGESIQSVDINSVKVQACRCL